MLDSLYSIIYVYFVSLSVITKILSNYILVTGSLDNSSLTTKSYIMDFHGYEGISGDLS